MFMPHYSIHTEHTTQKETPHYSDEFWDYDYSDLYPLKTYLCW